MYIVFSRSEQFSDEWTPDPEIVSGGFGSLYLFAIMWGVRVVTGVGGKEEAPETPLEMGYMLIIAFLVLFIVAALIGSVVDLVANMNARSEEFRKKMAHINIFMKNKDLPPELRDRIRKYYFHLWSRQGGMDDESILTELPARLRTEISLEINGAIISKVPFFKDSNPGFISALVSYLKPEIYAPGEWVVREGDVGHEMYFISQGTVDVVVNNAVVANLGEGAFFGEISLLIEATRTASIRAADYCDLFVLRKRDLDKVLKLFPEQKARIVQMAEMRITSDSLRTQVKKDSLFTTVSPEFMAELIKCFHPKVVQANEFFYHYGNHSDSMFFLGVGSLEILNKDEKQIQVITTGAFQPGTFFGDFDFVNEMDRTQSARALARCTACVLSRDDFEVILKKFPKEIASIRQLAQVKQKQAQIFKQGGSSKGKSMAKMSSMSMSKALAMQDKKMVVADWLKQVQQLKDDGDMKALSKEDMIAAFNAINELQGKLLQKMGSS